MNIEINPTYIRVSRLSGDRRVSDESHLLYRIKQELNRSIIHRRKQYIKKRMWRDGHLVSELQQYLRTRDGSVAIYNHRYAIEDAGATYNKWETVTLLREEG